MKTNTRLPVSKFDKFVIPVSTVIRMFVLGLDGDDFNSIWEQFGGWKNKTADGLIEVLTEDLSDSNNITFGGASHTLVPFNTFCEEFPWAENIDLYAADGGGEPLDSLRVYVDMEN